MKNVDQTDEFDTSSELSKNILFVAIYVHLWRGQFKIRGVSVQLDNVELVNKLITNPRWNLFPQEWKEKFTAVENKIKRVITELSVNTDSVKFPIKGVHIIARKSAPLFFQQINDIERKDFKPLVDIFTARWMEIVDKLQNDFDDPNAWSVASKFLPSSGPDLSKRFWIERVVVPITLDSQERFGELMGIEVDEYADEIKRYGEQFTKNVATLVTKGLEDELKSAVDNLTERITDKGIIKKGTLGLVNTAFNKLQSFEFVMTDELKAKIKDVKAVLDNSSAQDLNKDLKEDAGKVSEQLATYLKAVKAQVESDASTVRTFGRARRAIRV
jgi:hypothetical protein